MADITKQYCDLLLSLEPGESKFKATRFTKEVQNNYTLTDSQEDLKKIEDLTIGIFYKYEQLNTEVNLKKLEAFKKELSPTENPPEITSNPRKL